MPKEIKFKGTIFYYKDDVYSSDLHYYSSDKFGWLVSTDIKLNDEIEIIEEPNKIEKCKDYNREKDTIIFGTEYDNATELEKKIINNIDILIEKLDKVIDKVNKGDSNE